MRDNSTQVEILAAGAVAAFTVDLLIYPLDTIKTRYQSKGLAGQSGSTAPISNGFRGLYQGIGSVIFATLPAAAIFFLSYESAKSALKSSLPDTAPQPAMHAIASAGAELASCTVLTPAEVIKQNAQVLQRSGSRSSNRSSSIEALQMVWRSEGGATRRLWTGYTALLARNLPFTALQFTLFEFFRGHIWNWRKDLWNHDGQANSGTLQNTIQSKEARENGLKTAIVETGIVTGASAALSGSLAALMTTPLDVVKTRIMLSAGGPSTESASRIASRIVRQEGIRGIFRGAMLRGLWTALGSGLYLGSYEMAKIWLKGLSEEHGDLS
ncbi:putative S-adenosylmethionine mitochondrial carrier protein [Triangularia verruculosa]|uniref:S-adenosylmethionine mitochondrial carrier protein n=1 Tax=Triangularia verruculosa TaxID=2587418 RepID=A0AAN6XDW9_9PEZI|nr:putative S-adenosylmethionine mitochondrial carrier protein [Triangularia verruculosa]